MTGPQPTETLRCVRVVPHEEGLRTPFDLIVLHHHERRVRRTVLTLQHGDRVALDLSETVTLRDRDRLVLEDGREAVVIWGDERVLVVRGRDAAHLAELAWHLGNRHTPTMVEADVYREAPATPSDLRILIAPDPVLKRMLEGLGARVEEGCELFAPMEGAYHAHGHGEHPQGTHAVTEHPHNMFSE